MRCRVLVVGAGPAGAELCRILARAGIAVVLAERLADLRLAAFSSAAVPLEALDRFGLPASVVAARWRGWELAGPGEQRRRWVAETPLGAVLDFVSLRQWLVEEARSWGAQVLLGHRALGFEARGDQLHTTLQAADGSRRQVASDWLIDASGQARALLGDPPSSGSRHGLVSGVGLEWLIRLPREQWQPWSERLLFALGSGWVSQGYGWVFPMQRPCLKVGVCRLQDPGRPQEPLGPVLHRLIGRLFPGCGSGELEVLDRHGGRIRSTVERREPHRRGRLIAVVDAVSTANLLGGEGIRHALTSSRVLAPLLLHTLAQESRGAGSPPPLRLARSGGLAQSGGPASADVLAGYPLLLRRALGRRWSLSGRLACRTWLGLHDARADARLERLLRSLEGQPAEVLSDLLFSYRFERYGLRALPYLLGWS